jgi:hypothetical protein
MHFHCRNSQLHLARKPIYGFAGAALCVALISSFSAHAEDAAALRARVIQEVLDEVPDVELAKQIVEIRIKREYLKQQAIKIPPTQRVLVKQPVPNQGQ